MSPNASAESKAAIVMVLPILLSTVSTYAAAATLTALMFMTMLAAGPKSFAVPECGRIHSQQSHEREDPAALHGVAGGAP